MTVAQCAAYLRKIGIVVSPETEAQWLEAARNRDGRRHRAKDTYGGITRLDGIIPSLRLLVEDEKYSVADVGLMFGVSRERIRQLCEKYGISQPMRHRTGLMAVRVWDDSLNRFKPVQRGVLSERKRHARSIQAAVQRSEKYAERRRRVVAAMAALAVELGRSPRVHEIFAAVLGPVPAGYHPALGARLAAYLGVRSNHFRALTNELYAAAGLKKPGLGTPSHIERRAIA